MEQTTSPFFSSDAYLKTVAKTLYPNKNFKIEEYQINTHVVRLLNVEGKGLITDAPLMDYIEPESKKPTNQKTISFIPKLIPRTIKLPLKNPRSSLPQTFHDPAPMVDWKLFKSWEDYQMFVKQRSQTLFQRQKSRLRRLINEHGKPEFIIEDKDPKALMLCIKWKIEQYRGGHELLENPKAKKCIETLISQGILTVSSLKLHDTYLAIKVGALWNTKYLSMIPSYNPTFAHYAVGKELNHRLLEESYKRGDSVFDFLQGAETYKWDYATHLQLIEPAGKIPLSYKLKHKAYKATKEKLKIVAPSFLYNFKRLTIMIRKLTNKP